MAHLARRLHEDGVLRDGVSFERAEEVLWLLCSFDAFDLLFTGRGLSVDEAVDVLATTAESALCRPRAEVRLHRSGSGRATTDVVDAGHTSHIAGVPVVACAG